MSILKKITAALLSLIIVFTGIPIEDIVSYSYDGDKYYVSSITITKIYEEGGYTVKETKLTVQGNFLRDISIGTMTSTGYKVLSNPIYNTDTVQEYVVQGNIVGNMVDVGSVNIPIDQEELPTLSGISDRSFTLGEDRITISGSNLSKIESDPQDSEGENTQYNAYYENISGAGGSITINESFFTGNDTSVTFPAEPNYISSGTPGLQNIVLEKTKNIFVDFNNNNSLQINDGGDNDGKNKISVKIQNTYIEQFRLVNKITINNLIMNPNRGENGDEVIFTADSGLDNFDIFFLKNLTDVFTNDRKGTNTYFNPNVDGKQTLITQVPPYKKDIIENGEYFVVLTNKIPQGADPNDAITRQYVLDEKFTVIDASQKMRISSIIPGEGPDTGQEVEITGQYFGSLNITEFNQDNDGQKIVLNDIDEEKVTGLRIGYGTGTYRGLKVIDSERTIKVIIGNNATFVKRNNAYDVTFNDDIDKIRVLTPKVTDAESDPLKDVIIETETILTVELEDENGDPIIDGDGNPVTDEIIIKERAELTDGYTYTPSQFTPIIESIVPESIQVQAGENDGEYIVDELHMGIYGENFTVHKFVYGENNTEVTRYPIIEFGPELVLNPNEDPGIDIKVFNAQGQEVDGTAGLEIGSKILIKIPPNKIIQNLGKTYVRVTNPVKNSLNPGISAQVPDAIDFVLPLQNKIPVISEVDPPSVTVEGGETVTIEGSNFQEGVKVIIDGKEVDDIVRSQDGREITFVAPPGREGETQLIVMNIGNGAGMDTYPFTYVTTYTNPQLYDFNLKEGNTGTLVVVEGDNFLKPDPTASEEQIFKLIGTRILLEGEDINRYNRNPSTRQIELQDYEALEGEEIIRLDPQGKVFLEAYYHSVILKDKSNEKLYTIDLDTQNKIIISDGINENYTIVNSNGAFKAERRDASSLDVEVERDKIVIGDKELSIMTPFLVEDGKIIGDNVKVVNKNKIHFIVPILPADGYYDVTVLNPDTKSDSKLNEKGFRYYRQPQSNPKILRIDPNEGSTEGGYYITIYGEDFIDDGEQKTKVSIDGKEVNPDNIEVSINRKEIRVLVPPYPGDLREDFNTDRLAVPVAIGNPDGGSTGLEKGFTYVVPTSNPTITTVSPTTRSAAGGEVVEIFGTDFRYYEPYSDDNRDQERNPNEEYQNLNEDFEEAENIAEAWDDLINSPTREGIDIRQPEDISHKIFDQYFSSPILPKVFFGNEQAKIVEFSKGYIKVITPPGKAGSVDVYIVNNDSGISNKTLFTYEDSDPKITIIVPGEGKKQGRDKIEVFGESFEESSVDIYKYDEDNNLYLDTDFITRVRFGSITNKDISRDSENSGLINNGRATVNLAGGLTIEYNADAKTLTPRIQSGESVYQIPGGIGDYDATEVYIPVSLLENEDGNRYSGYELIRVYIEERRLFVERGYSPEVQYETSGHIIVTTPSYYTIGTVPLVLLNPDGGEAWGQFTYKNPDSRPRIINITKDGRPPIEIEDDGVTKRVIDVTLRGGNIISVIGDDFREDAVINIGDILTINPNDIDYSLPNKLTFDMPAVSEEDIDKLYRVVVVNEDGGIASSDNADPPIYIRFIKAETFPSITEVTPNTGPSSGGTRVTIKGENFREEMEGRRISIFFGEVQVPDENFDVIDYKTIIVYETPVHAPGTVEVKVENPDGALSEPTGSFTYLSNPKLISVVDPEDPYETSRIRSISVEGGQRVKLKGTGFTEGSRVVFAPKIEIADEESTGTIIYIDETAYVLVGGNDASEVELVDEETLTVTTPPGKNGTKGVIVINPDGGATNIYEDIVYGLPEVAAPSGVTAELIYDRYIRISWSQVTGAKEYEIHAIIDGSHREFVGTTKLTYFVYEDLEPNTEYKFVVTALGEYGTSEYSEESNTVETGRVAGPPDTDKGLVEETQRKKSGNKAEVIIGTDDYDEKEIEIDLTRGDLAGAKEVVVVMPAQVVSSIDAKDISIYGSDFRIKLNPRSFYTSRLADDKENNGVRFTLAPKEQNSSYKLSQRTAILSEIYVLRADVYNGQSSEAMDNVRGGVEINLDIDRAKLQLRRIKSLSLSLYDEYEDTWIPLKNGDSNDMSIGILADTLGEYTIIGNR